MLISKIGTFYVKLSSIDGLIVTDARPRFMTEGTLMDIVGSLRAGHRPDIFATIHAEGLAENSGAGTFVHELVKDLGGGGDIIHGYGIDKKKYAPELEQISRAALFTLRNFQQWTNYDD